MTQVFSPTMAKQETKTVSPQRYKKILLINPPYAMETGKGRRESYLAAALPPLGMLVLAGELEKHNYDVSFIDAEAEFLTDKELLARILKIKPDVVGISCITANFKRLAAFSKVIKEKLDAKIFFGGPHVWHHWAESVKPASVDFAVVGEAEKTCVELLEKLNKGESLKGVQGVAYMEDDTVHFAGARPLQKDLNTLAYAAFHLVDINMYTPAPQHVRRRPSVTMMAARGCPFKCTFCYVPFMYPDGSYRTRSVDHVVGEIKSLIKNHGVKEVQFMDDLFGANKKWLEAFLDRLIEEKIDLTWSCLTRLDILDWRLARKMKQAGCWCIFFGMESLDQEVLDAIDKRQTVEQIETAIKCCQEIGIEIRANFILGCPTETPTKAKKMIKRLCELNPDYVKFNVMCPYPGTKIYNEVKEGKWGKLIDDYSPEKMTNHEVVFVPYGYKDAKELYNMRKYAFRKYYFRPRYVFSRIKSIRTWFDVVRYWRGFKLVFRRYVL